MCFFKLIKFFVTLPLSVFSQGYFGRPNNVASHKVVLVLSRSLVLAGCLIQWDWQHLEILAQGEPGVRSAICLFFFLPISPLNPPLEEAAAAPGP